MNKQKLAIFDLDDTLIKGDSFRSLILENMARYPQLALFAGLRTARFLDRKSFAQKAHKAIMPLLTKEDFFNNFLKSLHLRLNPSVAEEAQDRLADGQDVVLISASPHPYVEGFAKQLGFTAGFGSDWRNNNSYDHLYASGKLAFAKAHYPQERYDWDYGISDSQSDIDLLKLCTKHHLWIPHD